MAPLWEELSAFGINWRIGLSRRAKQRCQKPQCADFVLANPRVLTGSILRPSPAPARGVGARVAFV